MDAASTHFLVVGHDDTRAELITLAILSDSVTNTLDRVSDGRQALDYLRRRGNFATARRPDVILLDLEMPQPDGYEVLRRIKRDRDLRKIPVVVLGASNDAADMDRAYALHANSYLTKPAHLVKFYKMMDAVKSYWSTCNRTPH